MKIINEKEYELLEDYKEGFVLDEITPKLTEYFEPYDYILGDWAYGKLRLKGFCDKNNKLYSNINAIEKKDEYLKNNCAFDCRYFILKKVK